VKTSDLSNISFRIILGGGVMIIRIAELPIVGDWDFCTDQAIKSAELSPIPDVLVLPELFTIGFDFGKISENTITREDLIKHPLASLAVKHRMFIVGGSFPVKTERGVINMLPVWDNNGNLIHTTEKVHLFKNMDEHTAFVAGKPSDIFTINGIKAGASICYDLRFPELFRRHALNGAKIIFLPAEWPEVRIELFQSLLRARAGEAQLFFVGCNLGGDHLGEKFRGGGGVVAPDGSMVKFTQINEYVKDYEIDINDVERVRERINCLEDRRPEIYQNLKDTK